jgi:hypothetical protein
MGTISPGKGKLQSLIEFKQPTNLQQIQGFLGLASYYRKFISMQLRIRLLNVRKKVLTINGHLSVRKLLRSSRAR